MGLDVYCRGDIRRAIKGVYVASCAGRVSPGHVATPEAVAFWQGYDLALTSAAMALGVEGVLPMAKEEKLLPEKLLPLPLIEHSA